MDEVTLLRAEVLALTVALKIAKKRGAPGNSDDDQEAALGEIGVHPVEGDDADAIRAVAGMMVSKLL